MSDLIFFGVLLGAFLHASWNAVVKSGTHKVMEIALVCAASGAISLVLLPFFPFPAPASWPYMAASTVLECIYYSLLAAAYRSGEMSMVYPLMRGTAPALVAIFGTMILGEHLSSHGWLAVLAICAGIASLIFGTRNLHGEHRNAVLLALATAVVIASYTMVDGIGVRLSGSAPAYAFWIFVLAALPIVVWALVWHRRRFLDYARLRAGAALFGGLATVTAYLLALFAMTRAPIALVAALRETSILFAIALSVLILRERLSWVRVVAGGLIAAGAVAIRLA